MIAQLDRHFIAEKPVKIISRLISYALFEGRPVSTKGRWINPFVFAIYSLAKRLPLWRPVKMPIFIVGTGRSGTTILGKLLALHKDVAFLNEPKALWHSLYPHEDIVGNFGTNAAYYRLSADIVTDSIIKQAHRMYSAVLESTCSRRIVDKYPEMIFRTAFLHAIFSDAKFLFIVRNGKDTCSSIEKWSDRHEKYDGVNHYDWWGVNDRKWLLLVDQVVNRNPLFEGMIDQIRAFDSHRDRAAIEWITVIREGFALLHRYPEKFCLVRYEELSHDPEPVLNSVLSFCGLGFDSRITKYAKKILRPGSYKKSLPLHPSIVEVFYDTMKIAGYN